MKSQLLTNENGELLAEIENYNEIGEIWSWSYGVAFDDEEKNSIPNPIHMDVEFFHGYKGLPPESSDVSNCVMSERMADAMKSAGVDNIDFYPVVLTHKKSGKTYRYFAYNIIGLLSAVDMEASDLTFYDKRVFGHASIHNLVLDENKINDLLIFRLKEQSSTVIVHERVKQALEKAGIDRVNFIRPENYIHL